MCPRNADHVGNHGVLQSAEHVTHDLGLSCDTSVICNIFARHCGVRGRQNRDVTGRTPPLIEMRSSVRGSGDVVWR